MSEEPISLGALAYVCNVYEAMTDFADSFREFQSRVDSKPDLDDADHRRALLKWLNAWGCRHLALSCHPDVSRELAAWHGVARDRLPGSDERLVDMNDGALEEFAVLFDHLSSLPAREVVRNGSRFLISFGPTAASKTLFALRPHVFVAWDDPMRVKLKHDRTGASYVEFLTDVRGKLGQLAAQCTLHGIDLDDLPTRLRRPKSTAPQLVGEYYWMTITRNVEPPGPGTLRDWLAWS